MSHNPHFIFTIRKSNVNIVVTKISAEVQLDHYDNL